MATYIARTMRPSGQVEKRKAATATATGLYYMAELKLDWTELELYVTLHWAIGSSFFSLSTIVENLMHPRGVEAAFTSSDGDCPRGLPFRRT